MSQERYLQIKKEHQVRKFVGRFQIGRAHV